MAYVEASILCLLLLVPISIALWRTIAPERATKSGTVSDQAVVFDLRALEPDPPQPFNQSGRYHMTMGLRKLNVETWLSVDKNYMTQHRIRTGILADKTNKVLQCLPGSEDACLEVLDLVVDHLTNKYPAMYKVIEEDGNSRRIENMESGEVFGLQPLVVGMASLETVARLVSEDINILKKGSNGGEHHL